MSDSSASVQLSPFPAIADYALISDCDVNALIAPSGNVEWLCLPRVDGPSVFAAILDRDAGGFRFGPHDVKVPTTRRYVPGTMVLETTWGTTDGWLTVYDLLLVGPWHHTADRSQNYRRIPTDDQASHVLLRVAKCTSGEVPVSMVCSPVFDYGRAHPTWTYTGEGYSDVVAEAEGSDLRLWMHTDLNLGIQGHRLASRTTMKAGDTHFMTLSWSDDSRGPADIGEAEAQLSHTVDYWHEWLGSGNFPDHPWREYLERSALTLKGLTFAPTGALVAAATTSLPETPGGERNWDYRYTWIRDSTLMLWALQTLGYDWEAGDFFAFLADTVADDEDLQIMYGVTGEKQLQEEVLGHLGGYEGAKPVRRGNGAFDQKQHDVWGSMLDSVYVHTTSRDMLDNRVWPGLVRLVESALAHWTEPDHGIWEMRGKPQHFVSSKMMCWVAADRGARLARMRDENDRAERWEAEAAKMHAEICEKGVDERGAFTQYYGSTALDAANLMMTRVEFLPPDDDRMRATVLAIADELTQSDLVLRYRVDASDDGLSGEEGTFTICSFWLVSSLSYIGEKVRARTLLRRLLALASPLGLYAEEIEASSGRHLGNFPQAFTHLGLIDAVLRVIADEKAGEQR